MANFRKYFSLALSLVFILSFLYFIGKRTVETAKDLPDEAQFSYYENRNLASPPVMTKESVLDGTYFTSVETFLKDYTSDRDEVMEMDTKINMNILKRPVVNQTVIGDGILLPYNEYETVDEAKIAADAEIIANNLKAHADQTESIGGKFYYIAIPCQYVFYGDEYPWYLNNRSEYTEKSTAALFGKLDEVGVSYINMGEVFESLGNLPEFSSNIDNHFGMMGAYETYRAMMDRINADTGYGLDILDEDNYSITELPNRYLGSRMRKLFGLWEDEEHLFKIENTAGLTFRRWNNGKEIDPLVYYHSWAPEDDVLYTMYMGGDIANTVIDTERDELPSILIYGDSFTNAVECVAWYSFDRMESIDFRHYKDKTLTQYIDEMKPDIVVCIRDFEAILNVQYNGQ